MHVGAHDETLGLRGRLYIVNPTVVGRDGKSFSLDAEAAVQLYEFMLSSPALEDVRQLADKRAGR